MDRDTNATIAGPARESGPEYDEPAGAARRRGGLRSRCGLRRRGGIVDRLTALLAAVGLCLTMAVAGCGSGSASDGAATDTAASDDVKTQTFAPSSGTSSQTLVIASGSENKEARDAIQHAVDTAGISVELHYMGSVDIMKALQNGGTSGSVSYDAVWPASSMWISMGDTQHLTKDSKSVSTTPIVFGVRKSKAVELGWANADGTANAVSTSDIMNAVSQGSLTFSMTSATQSNSGASAYLAFLTALAGTGGALTADDLSDTAVTDSVKQLLSGVDRSSGSSDWLKDMMVQEPDAHDAMVNYESMVIAADKELTQAGQEPLLAIYPSDGIATSDSPLAYVDRGQGDATASAFASFQSALTDGDATLALERAGRRCGLGGKVKNADDSQVQQAFRAEWGITTSSDVLKAITLPDASVIQQALTLYQTQLRKPSYTIWVVDYSGSMEGDGKDGVVQGLKQALDPTLASQSMIEPMDGDVNVFLPFSGEVGTPVVAQGTDTSELLSTAESLQPDGGTDIYKGLDEALGYVQKAVAGDAGAASSGAGASGAASGGASASGGAGEYTVAIILMTDGQSSESGKDQFTHDYQEKSASIGVGVPIFSIMFGDADSTQLDALAAMSNGKVFDGRDGNLADVFLEVKAYN